MPQRHKNLFGQIAHFGALVAASLTRPESERLRLERELQTGRYRPGRYRLVHQALCGNNAGCAQAGGLF
jgi:hypothetical protein